MNRINTAIKLLKIAKKLLKTGTAKTEYELSFDNKTMVWHNGRPVMHGTVEKVVNQLRGVPTPIRLWYKEPRIQKQVERRAEKIAQLLGLHVGKWQTRFIKDYEQPGAETLMG